MVADDNLNTSPVAEMRGGAAKRARKVLAAIAFSYLGVTIGLAFLCGPTLALAYGPQAVVSFLRVALESILHLPLLGVVPLLAVNALLTAEIAVELFRFGTYWTRSWSDRRHLITVFFVWIALLSGQLSFAILAR